MKFKLEILFPTAKPINKTKSFKTKDGRTGWALAKRWLNKLEYESYEKTGEWFKESILEKINN